VYRKRTPIGLLRVLAPDPVAPVGCPVAEVRCKGPYLEGRTRSEIGTGGLEEVGTIPDSFVLITIVLAIPVAGIIAALVASRFSSRRPDS